MAAAPALFHNERSRRRLIPFGEESCREQVGPQDRSAGALRLSRNGELLHQPHLFREERCQDYNPRPRNLAAFAKFSGNEQLLRRFRLSEKVRCPNYYEPSSKQSFLRASSARALRYQHTSCFAAKSAPPGSQPWRPPCQRSKDGSFRKCQLDLPHLPKPAQLVRCMPNTGNDPPQTCSEMCRA